jgi:multiple antibiotic resistance protein
MDSLVHLLSISLTLFLLMDPIGNVPVFLSVLKDISPHRQRIVIFRELIIALLIIVIFHFLGNMLLEVLRIQQATLLIAGGVILFLIALKMIFPQRKDANGETHDKEPFIVPLAVPLVAGPAVLAAVMLYSYQGKGGWIALSSIGIAWAVSTVILLAAPHLKNLLGKRGLIACERLMGLLLTLLAIQMLLEGLLLFIKESELFAA